jgi:hypothetical protein
MMRNHPRCAGGFLWVFADEGVVRTDQNGKIDNVGNYGADGIVGPHHEREGSFYTVKQIWSPVQIMNTTLPDNFDGTFSIENRYDFTNLKDCRFKWELKNMNDQWEKIIQTGEIHGVNIAPHASGTLKINLPAGWKQSDALYLTAYSPFNEHLWTWDWQWKKPEEYFSFKNNIHTLSSKEENEKLIVTTGTTVLSFCKNTGELNSVTVNGQLLSFGNGPRFIAARRGDRSMDRYYNHDDKEARSKERIYTDISGTDRLTDFSYFATTDSMVITTTYFGNMRQTRWVIHSNGNIRLDYAYQYDGIVELMGIKFDYPEEQVKHKRWLGKGPYRVWQNRMHGTNFGVWENDYNDPIPGETFIYPEFKGYFSNWRWVAFQTTEGTITLKNTDENNYLGVYTPRDGRDALLYTLPESGIAILKVIPAVRNKVNATDLIGPSSQAPWMNGLQKGTLYLHFAKE